MSTSERLENHYNTKYQAEESQTSAQILEYRSVPSNRFEACLNFFLSRFSGGDILELGAGSGLLARSLIAHGLKFDSYTLSELSSARLNGLLQSFEDLAYGWSSWTPNPYPKITFQPMIQSLFSH